DGVINIGATANVHGSGSATANAYVTDAIKQYATGFNGADANVTLTNDGDINISAIANADGVAYDTGTGTTITGPFRAHAVATIDGGIVQNAYATGANAYDTGDAAALIANDGTIGIHAVAHSTATKSGVANATATNDHAI